MEPNPLRGEFTDREISVRHSLASEKFQAIITESPQATPKTVWHAVLAVDASIVRRGICRIPKHRWPTKNATASLDCGSDKTVSFPFPVPGRNTIANAGMSTMSGYS